MIAMMATPYTAFYPNWYPYSDATNHITLDVNNLSNKMSFNGSKQIFVGDGSGLHIKHVSSSFIRSPFNSKTLVLKQLLHFPFITKNFISVSKFTTDYKVYLNSTLMSVMLKIKHPTTIT